ncbi:hypothetical protein BWQ96_05847 [Gracilariopsis chorda]|uniref:Kazal-like domain-containing protein n=1 Tax=Gracilariopsis chorda TaxID=448386 RepID=A0A2V3IQQ0_9FLOR|nr:hypothetical protein BWQ96_05847 [Gracilariopsis chorda]|eukprot:PXF44404.1 hypothetical protein BWQ96_05847 [Gracilariopsis chorda]
MAFTLRLLLALSLLSLAYAQTCNLPFCSYYGQRRECSFGTQVIPCAMWHTLATAQNPSLCDATCPTACVPADMRPIGSDGEIYCTPCALRYASCMSKFTVYGPVNFGTPSDLPMAPLDLAISSTEKPSVSASPLAETQPVVAPRVIPLPSPIPSPTGPSSPETDETPAPTELPSELPFDDIDESPMPTMPEESPILSPEQSPLLPLTCEGTLNIFQRIDCCNQFDIACVQEGQLCSTTGSLAPPVPCAKGLTCVVFDPGFPAADRPDRGICRSGTAITTPSPTLLAEGEFCSSAGSNFPSPPCGPGLFCDIFSNGFPAADVPNRGVCRPVGRTPIALVEETPVPNMPPTCVGELDSLALRNCCLESGVRCLQRGQICSTEGSRIPPVPCALGLTCRIFSTGFPAADIPNRGVCLDA